MHYIGKGNAISEPKSDHLASHPVFPDPRLLKMSGEPRGAVPINTILLPNAESCNLLSEGKVEARMTFSGTN